MLTTNEVAVNTPAIPAILPFIASAAVADDPVDDIMAVAIDDCLEPAEGDANGVAVIASAIPAILPFIASTAVADEPEEGTMAVAKKGRIPGTFEAGPEMILFFDSEPATATATGVGAEVAAGRLVGVGATSFTIRAFFEAKTLAAATRAETISRSTMC